MASRGQLEEAFDASLQFPNIYRPKKVINGLKESNIPIIISERPKEIIPSIWGILPATYSDDWQIFQKYMNTLNIPAQEIDSNVWYAEPFRKKRCLILVTGYYTFFIADDKMFPFYISRPSGEPYCLAGIYNQLEDGFFTSSFITCKASNSLRQIHNLNDRMPMVLPKSWQRRWLNHNLPLEEVRNMLKTPLYNELVAIPVSKHIFNKYVSEEKISVPLADNDFPMPLTLQHLLFNNNININIT